MTGFRGPIHLSAGEVEARVHTGPGAFALGYARPQEGAVFVSFVGRSDADLRAAVLAHVGDPYTACFWSEESSSAGAYRAECRLWHEMGGPEGDLDSRLHPVPPGDVDCPVCD
ncbi:MAG: hypothetical protein OER88_04810 [Planctomycetota bacterium]|nr:hypothetical protein [Planctomycetota bacterium]